MPGRHACCTHCPGDVSIAVVALWDLLQQQSLERSPAPFWSLALCQSLPLEVVGSVMYHDTTSLDGPFWMCICQTRYIKHSI